ncbi:hypothetical protein COS74_03000 [bacterium CG06_land_8_20_14_3_00_33_50]|nr:MAG: hypothetical protein COU50_03900 [bacterium CG10_big_fil_rev_8_21_14_0_10_33_18]PIU76642.1 MAG: hypothetical protein COS74_03000 [bacterium CG06_land_8_20_14_3_00_33_50]PIW81511.1 MAG: hypothetical protein COZ97_01390 [bacterium CG_4_8_14_3_um_filter_33_28]PIY85303.1 MAG: hypothetical protein COY76_02905 [bacterium CG_4_10_14_0_8_um_filter_33_57]PJA72158.1 MAG: hypothetical protein CO152_02905 [bacterium CG_4_9_14_3_um_filter_33_26]
MKEKIQAYIFKKTMRGYEFLLLKRGEDRGNLWQPVTGSIEKKEDKLDAAKREIREETGLKDFSRILDLEYSFEFKNEYGEFKEWAYGFEVSSTVEEVTISDEHQKYVWVNSETAHELLHWDSNKAVLKLIEERLKMVR